MLDHISGNHQIKFQVVADIVREPVRIQAQEFFSGYLLVEKRQGFRIEINANDAGMNFTGTITNFLMQGLPPFQRDRVSGA